LFGDKSEFKDDSAAVRFLGRAKSVDDAKILTKLIGWTQDIVSQLTQSGNLTTLYCHTLCDLNRALEPFMQQRDDPQIDGTDLGCCVWPFVKRVCIYLSNSILAKGIRLVDLPGEESIVTVEITSSSFGFVVRVFANR
jgi:hypothetical protein